MSGAMGVAIASGAGAAGLWRLSPSARSECVVSPGSSCVMQGVRSGVQHGPGHPPLPTWRWVVIRVIGFYDVLCLVMSCEQYLSCRCFV